MPADVSGEHAGLMSVAEERNRRAGERQIHDGIILGDNVLVFIPRAAVDQPSGFRDLKRSDRQFRQALPVGSRQVVRESIPRLFGLPTLKCIGSSSPDTTRS